MKKIFLLTSIICLTRILSGCQVSSDFVVVNSSDDFIEVRYEVKNPNYKSLTPIYVTSEEFNNNENNWRIIPEDRHEIEGEKGIVKVKLAPNEVLRVESVDAVRIKENPYQEFNTKSLRIEGKNGLINLEGNQVFEHFKPEDRSWALISYPTYVIYYNEH